MILKANEKEINIKLRIKNIIKLTKELNGKNLNEVFFRGANDSDIVTLVKILLAFNENEDGKRILNTENEVENFLDSYIVENSKTISDIYKELAEDINEQGFFNKKMSKEEIEMSLASNVEIDMDSIIENIVKQVTEEKIKPQIEQEFTGFKA